MPFFKKAGGQIFGCQLNKKEQAALEKEALAELAALDVKNTREIDAMILWFMHPVRRLWIFATKSFVLTNC